MIAELSSGHVDGADVLLLIDVVLFAVALVLSLVSSTARPVWLNTTSVMLAGFVVLALALFIV